MVIICYFIDREGLGGGLLNIEKSGLGDLVNSSALSLLTQEVDLVDLDLTF